MQLLPFCEDSFEPGAFAAAGLACPAAVARSVRGRQAGYFHGRACARRAMAQLGVPANEVGMGLRGEPLWPAGLVGSISHTSQLAGAMVQFAHRWRGVGIDLEPLDSGALLHESSDVFLSGTESALLTGANRELGLVIAFSAKESFYKAVYPSVQRFFDFDVVEITGIDWARHTIRFHVRQCISHDFPAGRLCAAHFKLVHAGSHVLTSFCW